VWEGLGEGEKRGITPTLISLGLINPPPSPLDSSGIFDKGEVVVFKAIWMPRAEARGASLATGFQEKRFKH